MRGSPFIVTDVASTTRETSGKIHCIHFDNCYLTALIVAIYLLNCACAILILVFFLSFRSCFTQFHDTFQIHSLNVNT